MLKAEEALTNIRKFCMSVSLPVETDNEEDLTHSKLANWFGFVYQELGKWSEADWAEWQEWKKEKAMAE